MPLSESGLSAAITMNTAMTAIVIAHHRRHHGRGVAGAESVLVMESRRGPCAGGAGSECWVHARPSQYRITPGVVGSGYQPAVVVGPVVVMCHPV